MAPLVKTLLRTQSIISVSGAVCGVGRSCPVVALRAGETLGHFIRKDIHGHTFKI